MLSFHRILAIASVLALATSVTACGDTWRGVKKDTGDNLETSGKALERGGENLKK
jgi:predicted small secreted protein